MIPADLEDVLEDSVHSKISHKKRNDREVTQQHLKCAGEKKKYLKEDYHEE